MKLVIPSLLLLGACAAPSADPEAITQEIAALRQSLDDLRRAEQPKFDTVQGMEDLSREIRRLRDRMAAPEAPPGGVGAAGLGPVAPVRAESLSSGVGGTQAGVNDLYWVLTRISVGGEERLVLALYQAAHAGAGFKLSGVRLLGPDLQMVEFGQDKPHVRDILELLKK